MHTEASLARAAALFDALGAWLLQPGAANGLRIAAHPVILAELLAWGGSIGSRTRIDGRTSETWWTLTGEQAERFIDSIEPFLTVKKEQARVFLAMRALVARPGEKLTGEQWNERHLLSEQLARLREAERAARWEPLPGAELEPRPESCLPPLVEVSRTERPEPRSGFDLLERMRRPAP